MTAIFAHSNGEKSFIFVDDLGSNGAKINKMLRIRKYAIAFYGTTHLFQAALRVAHLFQYEEFYENKPVDLVEKWLIVRLNKILAEEGTTTKSPSHGYIIFDEKTHKMWHAQIKIEHNQATLDGHCLEKKLKPQSAYCFAFACAIYGDSFEINASEIRDHPAFFRATLSELRKALKERHTNFPNGEPLDVGQLGSHYFNGELHSAPMAPDDLLKNEAGFKY